MAIVLAIVNVINSQEQSLERSPVNQTPHTMLEYRVTNVVLKSVLATRTPLDLPSLANVLTNVVYDPASLAPSV